MPEARRLSSLGASLCVALMAVTVSGSPNVPARGRATGALNAANDASIIRHRWLRGDRAQIAERGVRSRKAGKISQTPHSRLSVATASLAGELRARLTGFRPEFSRTSTSSATRTIRRFGARATSSDSLEALSQATVRWTAHALFHRIQVERPLHRAAPTPAPKPRAQQNDDGSAPQAQSLSIGQQIAAHALAVVGKAYVWGGESPQTGFDCSGLVQYVLSTVGIAVPRTSFAQYQVGTGVPLNALQPGDLLFFATYGEGASHVGIYIGAGRFVNALNSSTGVTISSLSDPYFSSRLLGARSPWSGGVFSEGA